MKRSIIAAAIAAFLLPGCSTDSSAIPPTAAPPPSGTARVTFVVAVPGGTGPNGRHSQPRYIAPSTQSIVISANETTILTANVAASSKDCTAVAGRSRTCSARAAVASTTQSFHIVAYDGARGSGNELAQGDVPIQLTPGHSQSVRVSLTGTPASLALSISAPYPPAGKPAKTAIAVVVLDADGNAIVGSYGSAISLSNNDTSGATKLSASSVSDSSTQVTLTYDGSALSQARLTAKTAERISSTAVFAPSPTTIGEYNAPQYQTGPGGIHASGLSDICIGPDGNVWGTDSDIGGIDTFDGAGKFKTFPMPGSQAMGISTGSGGNLWFAEQGTGKIGKITPSGQIVSYAIPVPKGVRSMPSWTMRGPDGRTWFLDQAIGAVSAGTIAPDGKIVKYPLPEGSEPIEAVAGPDGNLWITDGVRDAVLVLSTSGKLLATHYLTAGAGVYGITLGPDKNLWFTEYAAGRIGRMTTSGVSKEFDPPTAQAGPVEITAGPDGNLWFTESGGGVWDIAGKIAYITPDGSRIREFAAGTTLGYAHGLVFDTRGTLWYTKFSGPWSALNEMAY
jgi:virginiamycin B lyase